MTPMPPADPGNDDDGSSALDVLGWASLAPAVIASAVGISLAASLPRYERMFNSLGGKLPAITIFVLSQPWLLWAALPSLVCGATLAGMLNAKERSARVVYAVVGSLVAWLIVAVVHLAIRTPLHELEKALR